MRLLRLSLACMLSIPFVFILSFAQHSIQPVASQPLDSFPVTDESELDNLLGDTVVVGHTWYDLLQPGSSGHMIQYSIGTDSTGSLLHVCYTGMNSLEDTPHAYHNIVNILGDELSLLFPGGNQIDISHSARYPSLTIDPYQPSSPPFYCYNKQATPETVPTFSVAATFSDNSPNFYFWTLPWDEDSYFHSNPKMVMGPSNILHVLTFAESETNEFPEGRPAWYTKLFFDPIESRFSVYEGPTLITEHAGFAGGDIACSADGEDVAIILPVVRTWHADLEIISTRNKDLLLWTSEDYGQTWNFDNPTNITDFITVDLDMLPDSTNACMDTFRVADDASILIDEEDVIHVAFVTQYYNALRDQVKQSSQIWYWNNDTDAFIRLAHRSLRSQDRIGNSDLPVQRPTLCKIPDSPVVYCAYMQFGEPGDTLTEGDLSGFAHDRSAAGYLNADIYVVATSSEYGDYFPWTCGQNITNTSGEGGQIPFGQSHCERDPSLLPHPEGNHLDIVYQLDREPGTAALGDSTLRTNNPVVVQRAQSLSFLNNNYQPNAPLHVDGTGYIHYDVFVEENNTQLPSAFSLTEAYPNPFNSSMRISFSLDQAGPMQLAVYNLLGQQVATLLSRPMQKGVHAFSWHADDLPSGVYFIRLSNGMTTQTRKVVLLR